jgi:hypothetical protein
VQQWTLTSAPSPSGIATAGLATRNQKDLAVDIIEAEIRSAQHEVWLEAAKLVLTGEPVEIARHLRAMAERTIGRRGARLERSRQLWFTGSPNRHEERQCEPDQQDNQERSPEPSHISSA